MCVSFVLSVSSHGSPCYENSRKHISLLVRMALVSSYFYRKQKLLVVFMICNPQRLHTAEKLLYTITESLNAYTGFVVHNVPREIHLFLGLDIFLFAFSPYMFRYYSVVQFAYSSCMTCHCSDIPPTFFEITFLINSCVSRAWCQNIKFSVPSFLWLLYRQIPQYLAHDVRHSPIPSIVRGIRPAGLSWYFL